MTASFYVSWINSDGSIVGQISSVFPFPNQIWFQSRCLDPFNRCFRLYMCVPILCKMTNLLLKNKNWLIHSVLLFKKMSLQHLTVLHLCHLKQNLEKSSMYKILSFDIKACNWEQCHKTNRLAYAEELYTCTQFINKQTFNKQKYCRWMKRDVNWIKRCVQFVRFVCLSFPTKKKRFLHCTGILSKSMSWQSASNNKFLNDHCAKIKRNYFVQKCNFQRKLQVALINWDYRQCREETVLGLWSPASRPNLLDRL